MTSIPVPGSCTFSFHGTNTGGSTYYSSTSESFSDCLSRCQLDTRCNGFTHNSLDNSCYLHETSESAGFCYSCTFVSKSCIPSIKDEGTQDPEVYTDANIATCYDYHPGGFTVWDIYPFHTVSTWTESTERELSTLNILDTTEDDWNTFPMSSSLIAIGGTTSYSSQLPTEPTTAANTPDSYSVTLNKEYTTESQMYQVTSSEHILTTAAIVDDSSPTLSEETLESHSSSHLSPSTIEAEITSTTSSETLSEHVPVSTTNANRSSLSDQTAGAQVETTSGDTTETTYTSLLPESTTQHTVSGFDTSTNAPFSNEQTTQSVQHSSPEQKTILSESTSSTYVDFSSEVTSEPTTSDSSTNTQLLSSTGTSTNALLDTTTEESTSMAVSTTVSDSETSTLSHVSKTDTTSLVSTAVSTLVFESSTPMPSQHSSESISQNTEQGTITNTNAYFSTEKASQANLDTTTEEPEDDTVVTQITNGTVQCTCVCRTVNRTLEESIELRKKALSVKHKELSSNLRKLTSAPDFRPSSKAME
uniref:Mucin-3A-like n=1 Tax=Crassostrea virginica TaxID=6565 RepID=A0A8B8C8G6_CRAVI|nr:mucin-3A-like [Crassostrea virginica]